MCMARFFSSHYQVSNATGTSSADTDNDSDEDTESDEIHDETDTQQMS